MSLLWGWGKACSIDAFGLNLYVLSRLVTKSARRAKAAEEREATEEWVLRPRLPTQVDKSSKSILWLPQLHSYISESSFLWGSTRAERKESPARSCFSCFGFKGRVAELTQVPRLSTSRDVGGLEMEELGALTIRSRSWPIQTKRGSSSLYGLFSSSYEKKVVVFKKDPEILLSDSTWVFVHLSFCSRRRGEDRRRRACNDPVGLP